MARRGIVIRADRYYQRFGRCQYGVNRRHHDPLNEVFRLQGRFAAGIEAAASTGGQLMPPIMGAGAFVMASYTSIPYATIVAVSVIPAFLYFLSVAFVVRIEAVKHRVGEGIDMSISRAKIVLGALTFVIPLGVMIYLLMTGVTPSFAASGAIGVLIVASLISCHRTRCRLQ